MRKGLYLFILIFLAQLGTSAQKNKAIDYLRKYEIDSAFYFLNQDSNEMLEWQLQFLSELNSKNSMVDISTIEFKSSWSLLYKFYFLINQGDLLFYSRNDKNLDARNFYLEAFELVETGGNKVLICEAIKKILNINRYSYLQDNSTSSYYLQLYRENIYDQLETAYLNYYQLILSFQHYKAESWDKALADNLLEFTKSNQSNNYLNALIYQLHASYQDLIGNHKRAIEFELEALSQIKEIKYGYASTLLKVSQVNLIRYFIYNGQMDLAQEYLGKFSSISKNKLEEDFIKYIHFYQSIIDTTETNYKSAFRNLFEYVRRTEQVTQLNNQNLLKELEAKYETEKKEDEIRIQRSQLRTQSRWLWTVGIFLITLVVLGIGLINSFKKIKLKNRKIENLMRELHHRVKNNLQVISSLLGLQSMKLKDASARKAVTEGKERLRAMSLIHQKLYQNEDSISLNIREYISSLVMELAQSYGYQSRTKFFIDIPSIEMDADNSLPLGLIINELVSNSFKYAYKNIDEPTLEIKLLQEDKNTFSLFICDNGPGLPDGFKLDEVTSFGMKLVTILVKQLNGSLSYTSNEGLTYHINFQIK